MRLRSFSLFESNDNSTADRLECAIDSDYDSIEITQSPVFRDGEKIYYETDEDDEESLNVQVPTNQKNSRELILRDLHFVKAVKSHIDPTKCESFQKSLKRIKANKIKGLTFMTGDDFIARFMGIKEKMGNFRTLYSIIQDMEIYLTKSCKPLRPLRPQLIFFEEMKANGKYHPVKNSFKWASEMYNQLSVRDKSIYIKKHDQLMKNYHRKMKEFYKKYPNERRESLPEKLTPFYLFFNELKSKDGNLNERNALEQWKNLAIKHKATYVKKAYQYKINLTGNSQNDTISSKEKGLFSKYYGKPKKPPMFGYMLFNQAARNGSNLPGSYKSLPNVEKQILTETLNEMWQQYERRMLQYINGLSGKAKDKEQEEFKKIWAKYTLQKCVLKRNASEPPVNNGAAEDAVPIKKKKSANVRVGDGGNISGDVASNTKAKKVTLTENRTTHEMPTLSTKPTKKIKKAAPLPKQPKKKTVRKKNRVTKKSKKIEFTEVKPPKSLFRYFKSINSFDSPNKAKAHYLELSNSEKMNINKMYKKRCKSYLKRFREHLGSLKKTEVEAFVQEFNKKRVEESDDDDSLDEDEPCSSDSDH